MKILELKGDSFDAQEKHQKEIKMHLSEIQRLQESSSAKLSKEITTIKDAIAEKKLVKAENTVEYMNRELRCYNEVITD